jgi:hypothetical protein
VARIDLIDVGKTLAEPARRGGGGESTFQIQNLSLRIPDGQTMVTFVDVTDTVKVATSDGREFTSKTLLKDESLDLAVPS